VRDGGAGLAGLFGGGVDGAAGGGAGAVHGLAEEGIDAGLVAGTRAVEPGEDVGAETEGEGKGFYTEGVVARVHREEGEKADLFRQGQEELRV